MVDLSKLYPGDMVKVVDEKVEGSYIVDGMMTDLLGTIVTIRSIDLHHGQRGIATIEEDEGRFEWGAAAFELVVYNEEDFDAPPVEDFLASLSSLGY